MCTTLLTSWLVHSWFIRILGCRIIPDDSYFFIFTVIADNSGWAYSVDGDMRYMVYRWGFSYLDYPLEVSISWIYLLSPYNWFCHICLPYHLVSHSCSCMLVLMTQFSMHVYDSDLSIHMCLFLHATWYSQHHSLGSSNSPEFSCPGLRAWSWWIHLANQSGAT